MIWAWLKNYHRRECTYNFKDLENGLPDTIENKLPVSFVRRTQNRCLRYMQGYREGLIGRELEKVVKNYSSHRKVNMTVGPQLL
jgi:hypothetical protein